MAIDHMTQRILFTRWLIRKAMQTCVYGFTYDYLKNALDCEHEESLPLSEYPPTTQKEQAA